MYSQRPFQKGQSQGSQRPPLMELPPNMKMMFEPLAPLEFKIPVERHPLPAYSGVSQFASLFESEEPPKPKPFETPTDRKTKAKERLQKQHKERNELLVNEWDPHNNPKATENAYLTLFVGRLAFDTTEKKLRREFEQFGPIRHVRLVLDSEGKSRGYAFLEFENESDMTNAFRKSNGRKLDGKRIVCDVERGRTVRNWRPMRFGGGLGGRVCKLKSDVVLESANDTTQINSTIRDRDHNRKIDKERSRSRDRKERDRSRNRNHNRENESRSSDAFSDRDRNRGRDRGFNNRSYNNQNSSFDSYSSDNRTRYDSNQQRDYVERGDRRYDRRSRERY